MTALLFFLVVVVILKMMLQMGFYSTKGAAIVALFYSVVPLVAHTYALDLNRKEIEDLLSTPAALSDISLLIIVDLIMTVYFCLYRMAGLKWRTKSQKVFASFVRSFPSIIVVPAIIYIQLDLFFGAWGIPFIWLTTTLSIVIFVMFFASKYISNILFAGNRELMGELIILLSFLIFIYTIAMGLIKNNATVNAPNVSDIDINCFLFSLFVILVCIAVGYIYSKFKSIYSKK